MDIKLTSHTLPNLAAQWRVLALMLFAFARQLSALEKTGVRGKAAQAEQFGLWAGAALSQINRQIALLSDRELDEDETFHLNHMKGIALALLMMVMLAHKLHAGFLKLGKATARAMARGFAAPEVLEFATEALRGPVEILDPG